MQPLVSLQRLSRRYGPHHALEPLDLELQPGEILGLLGPNGAGKSTCLRLISGTLAPSSGRVLIDGIDLAREPLRAKQLIGYLPENPPLYPELTVDEYLLHCARLHRVASGDRDRAVAAARERCGIGGVGGRLIGNLSDGFKQRIGIAQAIVHRPRLLVLDEPTSRLDPNQIRQVRELLRELGRDHGVILSTHILPEVQVTCDRVAILHQGRLHLDQSLQQLADDATQRVCVTFDRPPPALELERLPGVVDVEAHDPLHFTLQLAPAHPPSEIVAQAVGRGWPLAELTPERSGLERLFTAVTNGEPAT